MEPFDEPTPGQLAEIAAKEQAYKDKLKSLGYKLDGSIDDWYLLMNNLPVFGANWKKNADDNHSVGMDFLQYVKTYIS